MHATFHIARRFLITLMHGKTLATMLMLCAISTCISIATCTLIAAIMNGFQEATLHALQGIHSDIILQTPAGTSLSFEKVNAVVTKEFSDVIAHATPIATQYAIIQTKKNNDISHVIMMQGIDPKHDEKTRAVACMVKKKRWGTQHCRRIRRCTV